MTSNLTKKTPVTWGLRDTATVTGIRIDEDDNIRVHKTQSAAPKRPEVHTLKYDIPQYACVIGPPENAQGL